MRVRVERQVQLVSISVEKPAYHVPSMAEVRAIEPNGFTVASLFSGCGGSSLGYRMAGFKTVYANEFIEAARDTYRANAPDYAYLDPRDIREVTGKDILDRVGPVDLLDGSPPCASFSTAGKRHKAWGTVKEYSDTKQRTDDLFLEYARIVRDIQPKVFVAENVLGLVKGSAKGYFKLILNTLRDCGYRVEARLLDASWLGVPQARQRLIFVGVRNDLGFAPVYPKPMPYRYTVRDAICQSVIFDESPGGVRGGGFNKPPVDITDKPARTITTDSDRDYQVMPNNILIVHDTEGQFPVQDRTDHPARTITTNNGDNKVFGDSITNDPETGQNLMFGKYTIYDAWKRLGLGESPEASMFNLIRTHPDKPSPTISACHGHPGTASIAQWERPRKFTLGELRRLCGFPDDFVLTGTYAQRWERLGRAVPPLMMRAVAREIATALQANAA